MHVFSSGGCGSVCHCAMSAMLIRFDRLSPKKEEKHPPPLSTYSVVGDTILDAEGEMQLDSSFITSDKHEAAEL